MSGMYGSHTGFQLQLSPCRGVVCSVQPLEIAAAGPCSSGVGQPPAGEGSAPAEAESPLPNHVEPAGG